MRRTTIVAACSAATCALPLITAQPAAAHHAHVRTEHLAPLPRPVMFRLATRARHLHRVHPARPAYQLFLVLARRWRQAHARPAPDAVVPSVGAAADRYGLDADGMLRVARCESGLDRSATNGQYLGLFQLGSVARALYLEGDWNDAYANALAAARYARAAGSWAPWACGFRYGAPSASF